MKKSALDYFEKVAFKVFGEEIETESDESSYFMEEPDILIYNRSKFNYFDRVTGENLGNTDMSVVIRLVDDKYGCYLNIDERYFDILSQVECQSAFLTEDFVDYPDFIQRRDLDKSKVVFTLEEQLRSIKEYCDAKFEQMYNYIQDPT